MVRKRKKKLLGGLLLLLLGMVLGYTGAVISLGQAVPEARPLPSEAQPLQDPGSQKQQEEVADPGSYSQGKMIFQGYLGIYGMRIAIYHGQPPHGSLQYVTDYEVREDLREQLAAGVSFRDAGELLALLENYTS